ncbi:MAG: dephospho-CoA kinase [Burkholderiales bacterium]|nr:dephospho-CoA kinase [Phycisphaerae bacterium]
MIDGKPIIGIVGGIGSGKSMVADLFGELGASVFHADQVVHQLYTRDEVRKTLRGWWGDSVFHPDGSVNRAAIAISVFQVPKERARLEAYVHPLVDRERERLSRLAIGNQQIKALIWDVPLLVETDLHKQCDVVVFVDGPVELRRDRVKSRGWDAEELARRENFQLPLDTKRQIADYVISNVDDVNAARSQVRVVFSRIRSKFF